MRGGLLGHWRAQARNGQASAHWLALDEERPAELQAAPWTLPRHRREVLLYTMQLYFDQGAFPALGVLLAAWHVVGATFAEFEDTALTHLVQVCLAALAEDINAAHGACSADGLDQAPLSSLALSGLVYGRPACPLASPKLRWLEVPVVHWLLWQVAGLRSSGAGPNALCVAPRTEFKLFVREGAAACRAGAVVRLLA